METAYQTEEEFLKHYDPKQFDQLSMTADILLISVSNHKRKNYRKTSKKAMSILLVKRTDFPFKGKWCLPGGFLNPNGETLEECAKRVLKRETNLQNIFLEQLYTYDDPKRDPRTRVVSTSYMALVDKEKLTDMINENASWFDVVLQEETNDKVEIVLDNGTDTIKINVKKILREKTTDRYQFQSEKGKDLAFDHLVLKD